MKELKDIVLKKGDIVYFADNSWTMVRPSENNGSVEKIILPYMTANKITKIERPTQYKTIYEVPKQILDKEEKEYLEAVIRPFKNRVKYIEKEKIDFYYPTNEFLSEYIYIDLGDNDESFPLPRFNRGAMYKGMAASKKYTLDELGLFERRI